MVVKAADKTVVIGLAADSGEPADPTCWGRRTGCGCVELTREHTLFHRPAGCGKSTFMRRMTSIFGGAPEPPKGERGP